MKQTEKKRKDILDAAIREFQEQGFNAARVNRIAERAEVSKRTLYKHFESKERLFAAITDILLEETASMPKLRYTSEIELRVQLIDAVQAYIGHLTGARYIGLNRLVLSELLRDQALARAFFDKAAMQDGPVSGLIAAAMQAGALRATDPTFAANQLLSMAKHFLVWPKFLLDEEAGVNSGDIIADCVDMFLAHYGPKNC